MPAGPFSEETIWSTDLDNLILQPLGDVTVVFHKVSGDTHILNFLSVAAAKVLSTGGETFASAAPKILKEIQMSTEDCPDGLIKETILQLDDAGVVAPVKRH